MPGIKPTMFCEKMTKKRKPSEDIQVSSSSSENAKKLKTRSFPIIEEDGYEILLYPKVRQGIVNLSNTCYIGCSLQVLASCPHLLQDIFTLPTDILLPGSKSVVLALQVVLLTLFRENQEEKLSKVAMTNLCQCLNVSPEQPGDANEMLSAIFDSLVNMAKGSTLEQTFLRRLESRKSDGSTVNSSTIVNYDQKSLSEALKTADRLGAPADYLTVQINRAVYNKDTQDIDRKIDNFQYPTELRPEETSHIFPDNPTEKATSYDLHAVFVHQYKEGWPHYTVAVRGDSQDKWTLYDDQAVTSITEKMVMGFAGDPGGDTQQPLAGVLVYRKRGSSADATQKIQVSVPPHIRGKLELLESCNKSRREAGLNVRLLDSSEYLHLQGWTLLNQETLRYRQYPIAKGDLRKGALRHMEKELFVKSPRLHFIQNQQVLRSTLSPKTKFEEFAAKASDQQCAVPELKLIHLEGPDDRKEDHEPVMYKIFHQTADQPSPSVCFLTGLEYVKPATQVRKLMTRIGQEHRLAPARCSVYLDEKLADVTQDSIQSVIDKCGDVIPVLLLEDQNSCEKDLLHQFITRETNSIYLELQADFSQKMKICVTDACQQVLEEIGRKVQHPTDQLQIMATQSGVSFEPVSDLSQTLSDMLHKGVPRILRAVKLTKTLEEHNRTLKLEMKILQAGRVFEKSSFIKYEVTTLQVSVAALLNTVEEVFKVDNDVTGRFHLARVSHGMVLQILDDQLCAADIIDPKKERDHSVAAVLLPCDLSGVRLVSAYLFRNVFFNRIDSPGIIVCPENAEENDLMKILQANTERDISALSVRTSSNAPVDVGINKFLKEECPLYSSSSVSFTRVLSIKIK